MVCEACMNKAPFLWTYAAHFAVSPVVNISCPDEEEVEIENNEEKKEDFEPSQNGNEEPSTSQKKNNQEEAENKRSPCKRTHKEMSDSSVKITGKMVPCRLKELQSRDLERPREGAVFWPCSWRSELCTCTSCKRAYVAAQVQFLMDPSDTLLAYENKGLEEPFGQHPLLALTDSMSHVQQLEVIYGLNEMTTALTSFFEKCVAEGKAVTAEAVHQCFDELHEKARKRRRTNAGNQ